MAKYVFLKSYRVYYMGSVEAKNEDEAYELAYNMPVERVTPAGDNHWEIEDITKVGDKANAS